MTPATQLPPAPLALAPPQPAAQAVFAGFLTALLDHTPDSLRRLGAAVTLVVVPFLNAWCFRHLNISVPDAQIAMIEGGLTVYITQSAVKAIKALGIATPVLIAAVVLSSSCAHAPSPLRITGTALDAAELTFEATSSAMLALNHQHQLTAAQVADWNEFLATFQVAYPNARNLWVSAEAHNNATLTEQAAAVLSTLLTQLDSWKTLALGIRPSPDGGAP